MDLSGKLWSFCNKLRHDGVDASDYIEQLTYLLFLKMADEKQVKVPKQFDWKSLVTKDEKSLIPHLEVMMEKLKQQQGLLGDIFAQPVSRVRNASILKSLIEEINSINWSIIDADIVGIAFEELIGRVANEGKKGAGQYFTPRPLIESIVRVMKPDPTVKPTFRICDVACGTAGFLVSSLEWLKHSNSFKTLSIAKRKSILKKSYFGQELVQRPRRLALMNMFLHGAEAQIDLTDTIYGNTSTINYDCILTNPPFGNKGANEVPKRNFPVKTSDKQLNFIQHVIERLAADGRAAMVLPDGCLNSEAAIKLWSYYLNKENSKNNVINIHTVLKLPEGVFASYANGVKACVIFFQKGKETKKMWIYDGRKNQVKITTKSNILNSEHFIGFEKAYGTDPNGAGKRHVGDRFKFYTKEQIIASGYDLSFTEIHKPEALRNPKLILDEMIADYESKIAALKKLRNQLTT